MRDFAAGELGLAVLLVCAAVWFERRLVLVAAAAITVGRPAEAARAAIAEVPAAR